MKPSTSGWIAGGLLLSLGLATAQTQTTPPQTNDSRTQAIELLRRTIAEQKQNPNRIIREPRSGTSGAASEPSVTRADLERQYLEGKLTARQYQKALDGWQQEEQKRAAEADRKRVLEALQQDQAARESKKAKAARAAAPPAKASVKNSPQAGKAGAPAAGAVPSGPVAVPPTPVAAAAPPPTAQQTKLSEVEARLDEMLRLKAQREVQREKAALTNATGAAKSGPATAQTKRQRLDALLKQLVDGGISETEYKEKRAKVLASPE